MPRVSLPLGRYLLLVGPHVGNNSTVGMSVGTRVLPDAFLEQACAMFCSGDVIAGAVLPHRASIKWPGWNLLADGSVPDMESWVVGYRDATPDRVCPWDLYFWDGNWWDEDGTELADRFPTTWLQVPDELLRIAKASKDEHGKTK